MAGVSGSSEAIKNHAAFIWSVADLLRGDYKQSEYGKVVLPLTVLRRFDCVLAPVKQAMLDRHAQLQGKVENFAPILDQMTDTDGLWNTSRFDIPTLLNDPDHIADNLRAYIHGFSPEAREILDRFEFASQITRLHKSGLLYLVLGKFAERPSGVCGAGAELADAAGGAFESGTGEAATSDPANRRRPR